MQKKKNIRLLISLVILILTITALFVFTNRKINSSIDKNLFQISNLEKIDRIVLESEKTKTELKFDGVKWKVNNRFEADNQMITVLFATLKQTQAKRKVASHLQDSLQKEITTHGTKISCYEGNNLSKEIWCEGNTQKTETYFQLNNDKPYLVTIPGYRVFIASIFEMPVSDWRDRRVFNFNWQNIKSLEVNFANEPKQSFKASFQNNFFSIEGIATDTTKLDNFMDALFQLRVEKFLDSTAQKGFQSSERWKPLIEIKISDVANQTYPLTIYSLSKENGFLIGKINDEVAWLNPNAVREIFRKKDYFVQKKN